MITLIKRIFEDYKEPLYGRKTGQLKLNPFSLNTQKQILKDLGIYNNDNLLKYYSVFFGIPKYYEILFKYQEVNSEILINILKEDSIFLNEGKNIIIEEFPGKHNIYFSILTAISLGNTKKSEISNYTGIKTETLGKYLQNLENYYELINRQIPIFHKKEKSKLSKYEINDLFLKFWFRYIYKRKDLIELGDMKTLRKYVENDFNPKIPSMLFKDYLKLFFTTMSKPVQFFYKKSLKILKFKDFVLI